MVSYDTYYFPKFSNKKHKIIIGGYMFIRDGKVVITTYLGINLNVEVTANLSKDARGKEISDIVNTLLDNNKVKRIHKIDVDSRFTELFKGIERIEAVIDRHSKNISEVTANEIKYLVDRLRREISLIRCVPSWGNHTIVEENNNGSFDLKTVYDYDTSG